MKKLKTFMPWVTPKIFPDLSNPGARVAEFFDHYGEFIAMAETLVVAFATGNGDQVFCYGGKDHWEENFEWARYNNYQSPTGSMARNLDWLQRVRDGGERSYNPYLAGPCVVISEQKLNYRLLAGIYRAFREEAARHRGVGRHADGADRRRAQLRGDALHACDPRCDRRAR